MILTNEYHWLKRNLVREVKRKVKPLKASPSRLKCFKMMSVSQLIDHSAISRRPIFACKRTWAIWRTSSEKPVIALTSLQPSSLVSSRKSSERSMRTSRRRPGPSNSRISEQRKSLRKSPRIKTIWNTDLHRLIRNSFRQTRPPRKTTNSICSEDSL